MKAFTSLTLVLLFCSNNTYATELKLIASDNNMITKICMAAAADNTKVMIRNIRKLKISRQVTPTRALINSLHCNNQYIGNFAKTLDAQNTFAYLDQYTNKKNKKRQANITIIKVANEQGVNKGKTVARLVSGN